MGGLGGPEVLIIAGVLILLFGAKKLPEMARSLGKAKGEFKKGIDEEEVERAKSAEQASITQAKARASDTARESDTAERANP